MPAPPLTNTLITIYVNTAVTLTQNNIKDNVWFADTDGDIIDDHGTGGTVENYLTEITKNGNVTWVGAVQDIRTYPSDYVLITGIDMSNGNQNKINLSAMPSSPANGNPTHVNGRVTGNASPLPMSYSISIKVGRIDSNGQRITHDLTIDPRLRIIN